VGALRRIGAIVLVLVAFPIALVGLVSVAVALGQGLAIYLGVVLAAWLLFALVLPMVTGVMGPSEVLESIWARRRHLTHFEGERLPSWREVGLGIGNGGVADVPRRSAASRSSRSSTRSDSTSPA
jgi:hypothetical protein